MDKIASELVKIAKELLATPPHQITEADINSGKFSSANIAVGPPHPAILSHYLLKLNEWAIHAHGLLDPEIQGTYWFHNRSDAHKFQNVLGNIYKLAELVSRRRLVAPEDMKEAGKVLDEAIRHKRLDENHRLLKLFKYHA